MKNKIGVQTWPLPFKVVFFLTFPMIAAAGIAKSVVDDVNPFIGTDAHGHVYPGATADHAELDFTQRNHRWRQIGFDHGPHSQ